MEAKITLVSVIAPLGITLVAPDLIYKDETCSNSIVYILLGGKFVQGKREHCENKHKLSLHKRERLCGRLAEKRNVKSSLSGTGQKVSLSLC